MKIIVTGATSIIGVPLIKKLIKEKHNVYAMVRPGSPNIEKLIGLSPLNIIELKLEEAEKLSQYLNNSCDICFHLGWDGAGSENRKKKEIQQRNVTSSMKVLKALANMGCKKFIFSGSQAEYGIYYKKITEAATCFPVSEYGKAKVDFLNNAIKFLETHPDIKMEYIHTRIFSIYGPDEHKGSLIDSCLEAFLQKKQIELGECSQLWNYLYIDDLVEALLALMNGGTERHQIEIYNIAGVESDTKPLREYINDIYICCGQKGKYILGKRSPNAEGIANLNPDISKIMARTGWRPSVKFTDGINEIINQRSKRHAKR